MPELTPGLQQLFKPEYWQPAQPATEAYKPKGSPDYISCLAGFQVFSQNLMSLLGQWHARELAPQTGSYDIGGLATGSLVIYDVERLLPGGRQATRRYPWQVQPLDHPARASFNLGDTPQGFFTNSDNRPLDNPLSWQTLAVAILKHRPDDLPYRQYFRECGIAQVLEARDRKQLYIPGSFIKSGHYPYRTISGPWRRSGPWTAGEVGVSHYVDQPRGRRALERLTHLWIYEETAQAFAQTKQEFTNEYRSGLIWRLLERVGRREAQLQGLAPSASTENTN